MATSERSSGVAAQHPRDDCRPPWSVQFKKPLSACACLLQGGPVMPAATLHTRLQL